MPASGGVGTVPARMQIISRYVFRQAAGVLLLILLSLGGIVWIALALRELNVVTSGGQNAFTLLKMTTLALPNLLGVIAPFALLIAVVQVLSRLNGDSELIVLTASGATIWSVARPLLALAALVSIAVAIVNHFGMPWSLRTLRENIVQMRTDLLTQVIQPGRFSTPESGLTFHIRDRSQNGELLGLIMQDQRKPPQTQAFLASRGVIVKQEDDAYLVMTDGHIVNRNKPDEPAQLIEFDRYAVDLDQFEAKTAAKYEFKPRERYFSELMWPDTTAPSYKKSAGHYRAELHERLSNPLYPFAFVMIALATVGQAQSTRQNRVASVLTGLFVAAGVRMGGLALNNVVVVSAAATPLLYALPIGAVIVSIFVMRRAAKPRPGPAFTERLIDAVQAAALWAWGWVVPRRLAPGGR
jgi:lipopolysaccharide export system permease protein